MKKIYFILSILCASLFAVSCSNELEKSEEVGYLKLELNTLVSTHTRVTGLPSDYDAKKLHVVIANGTETVMESDWENGTFANSAFNDKISLPAGITYTISAHSANWDGTATAESAPYYEGSTTVTINPKTANTVKLTCTLANVKVTVNWDSSMSTNFATAYSMINSTADPNSYLRFTMGEASKSIYVPVAPFSLELHVKNLKGVSNEMTTTIDDVNARDHFIINYKLAEAGKEGTIDVYIDETTKTYTYTFNVALEPSTSLTAAEADAWSTFAYLSGEVSVAENFSVDKLKLQWKASTATDWTDVAGSSLTTTNNENYSYKLTGLTPETVYTYRLVYEEADETFTSDEVSFTTEPQTALYNGGFENWYSVSNYYSPNEEGTSFWDTSNPGSASFNYVVTEPETSFVHGGTYSVKLASKYAVIKLAAGSIYTGKFGKVSGTAADLYWGVPFGARPTALHGYICYAPGSVNRGTRPDIASAPASGENDHGSVRIALLTEQLHVNNKDMSTFPAWDGSDDRVIAHGMIEQGTSDNGHSHHLQVQWQCRDGYLYSRILVHSRCIRARL